MIPNITASTVYATLGNNSSLVPLAIKDVANSIGLTTASYMSGDKAEGKIDLLMNLERKQFGWAVFHYLKKF